MLTRIAKIKYFFKDPNKKKFLVILKEMITYGWVKREVPTDYFRKFLYRKEITDITSYLSLKEYYSIIESNKILVPDIASILENKLSFSLFAEKHHLPSPNNFSYNIGTNFYFEDKVYNVFSMEDLIDFFKMVFNKTNQSALFLKPITGIGGQGCFVLKKDKLEQQIKETQKNILQFNYLHQEKLTQHPTINKIHVNSINTLRVNTYLDKQGESHIISALMRFGAGSLVTDNESSGGFYIGVDLENKSLIGKGKQSITRGSKEHTHHPDSKVLLEGFKIPLLNESIELALLAAVKTPTRIIGWDIAITETGPVIIEGNSNPSLNMADIAYGGLCKHPLIKDILTEINQQ